MKDLQTVDLRPDNVDEHTLFCIKDRKNTGYKQKKAWFASQYEQGLRIRILKEDDRRLVAFIEYLPATEAWRPVKAPGYMFVHCMFVYSNSDKGHGLGSELLDACATDARRRGMHGVCAMTSKGSWLTDCRIFKRNGFVQTDTRGRFELMTKKLEKNAPDPLLLDWTWVQAAYRGWHLLYADQCPWHDKAAKALSSVAADHGIELNVHRITSAEEARNGPSGFGVFALIQDGQLLADHYISATRFRNILSRQ